MTDEEIHKSSLKAEGSALVKSIVEGQRRWILGIICQ